MKKFTIITLFFFIICSVLILILNAYDKFNLGREVSEAFMKIAIQINTIIAIVILGYVLKRKVKLFWSWVFILYFVVMLLYYFLES